MAPPCYECVVRLAGGCDPKDFSDSRFAAAFGRTFRLSG
jgi:hypothetical protein